MSRPETLRTRWTPEQPCPLPGYPRPQLVRPDWLNLNGLWEYAVTPLEQSAFPAVQGHILVPYAIESALSGVQRALLPDERLWYRRTFAIPAAWLG